MPVNLPVETVGAKNRKGQLSDLRAKERPQRTAWDEYVAEHFRAKRAAPTPEPTLEPEGDSWKDKLWGAAGRAFRSPFAASSLPGRAYEAVVKEPFRALGRVPEPVLEALQFGKPIARGSSVCFC